MATLDAIAIDSELVSEPLERLARLTDDLALARERWVALKRPMTQGGSTKQRQPHVLLVVMAKLRGEILDLEGELGLTPAGARRLGHAARGGRPQGAASAPDRAARPRRKANVIPLEVRRAMGDAV